MIRSILLAMRASRLVNILLLLQTRGRLTAGEIASELEVSVRTVYRDIEALSEAGIPIYAERGPHGGVRLVDGYRTRLTGLTTEEAEALFLSGLPGPAAALGLGTVVVAARLKVLAALPPELRARAARISERFYLDAPAWFQAPEELPHLPALAEAVWESRRIEIRYRRPGAERPVTRELEPLGIVLKGGVWYLVARSGASDRTYRVSRVVEVSTRPDHFERPAGFDLATHWSASIAAYERDQVPVDVVLRVAPDDAGTVVRLLDGEVLHDAGPAEGSAAEHAAGGMITIRARFTWLDEAETAMFRLGPRVEILEPAELRQAVLETARSIVRSYETAGAEATGGRP